MSIVKLKNNKYFLGDFRKPNKYRGWFVGSFLEKGHPCKTDKIEVLYAEHKKGDSRVAHFHKKKIELIIMISGRAKYTVNGKVMILKSGNFLFVDVNNVISAKFLAPSKIFAIHSPSIPTDKYEIEQ